MSKVSPGFDGVEPFSTFDPCQAEPCLGQNWHRAIVERMYSVLSCITRSRRLRSAAMESFRIGVVGLMSSDAKPTRCLRLRISGLCHRLTVCLIGALVWLQVVGCPAAGVDSTEKLQGRKADATSVIQDLLSRLPIQDSTRSGTLTVRDSNGHRSRRAIRHQIHVETNTWEEIWDALPDGDRKGERLVIVHHINDTNRYTYWRDVGRLGVGKSLSKDEIDVPFAGSDFWLSDLGLEFLRWPTHTIVKDRVPTSFQRLCTIVESVRGESKQGGYFRVLSWIDLETRALLRAEAFDLAGRRIKSFQARVFRSNGSVDLDLWNDKKDSKSSLEFQSDRRDVP
jgi:hypothetical protein